MRMGPEDLKEFPDCANLLQHIRHQVSPKILNAFIEACMAEPQNGANPAHVERAARAALVWSQPPLVDVNARPGLLRVPKLGQTVDACGYTPPFSSPVIIIITRIWFDAYETCSLDDRPANAMRLTRTVLHEMVHWVRDAVGADEHIQIGGFYKGTPEEAGEFFEKNAYGGGNICNDTDLNAAKNSMRIPIWLAAVPDLC